MARQGAVVVVDDEPDIGGLLIALFESEGYRTALATSGAEALDLIARVKPGAVVLDLSLPDLDGVQVLHLLKEQEELSWIPVIVVSAFTGRLTAADKVLLHAVFEKPFDLDALSATVGQACTKVAGPTCVRQALSIPGVPADPLRRVAERALGGDPRPCPRRVRLSPTTAQPQQPPDNGPDLRHRAISGILLIPAEPDPVIPAQAGIQGPRPTLDPRFRGDDDGEGVPRPESTKYR